MIFVIDTNILVKGFIENDLATMFSFIHAFFIDPEKKIALDHNRVMLGEYSTYLDGEDLFQKWFVHLQHSNQIYYVSGALTNGTREKLLELGFHEESDQTFVAAAINTDRIIVTEDSDYGKGNEIKAKDKQEVLAYMVDKLNLKVFDTDEVCKFIKN
jgi:hypothetical protein